MADNSKINIFYKPKVDIERRYDTIGTIPRTVETTTTTTTTTTDEFPQYPNLSKDHKELKDQIDKNVDLFVRMRRVTDLLPGKLPETIGKIVEKMALVNSINGLALLDLDNSQQYIQYITTYEDEEEDEYTVYEETPEETAETHPGDEEEDPLQIYLFNGTNTNLVVYQDKSPRDQCREQYLKDMTNISQMFGVNLNGVMQDYLYSLGEIMNVISIDNPGYLNYEYQGEVVTGITTNLMHVNDNIVTNSMFVEQLDALISETLSPRRTNNILKAFEASELLRERYYEEDYKLDVTNALELHQDVSLELARLKANASYERNKVAVYNFLENSVEKTEEICNRQLSAQESKALLLANDINIYAHTEYETTGVENSETKGTATNIVGTDNAAAKGTSSGTTATSNTTASASSGTTASASGSGTVSGNSIVERAKNIVDTQNTSYYDLCGGDRANGCTSFCTYAIGTSNSFISALSGNLYVPDWVTKAKSMNLYQSGMSGIKAGDILVYDWQNDNDPDHVVIYGGNSDFYGNSTKQEKPVHYSLSWMGADPAGYIRT